MQNKSAFTAELNRGFMFKSHRILERLALRAFAEEGGDPAPDDGGNPTPLSVNFEQMIAQARKEEKDKLYPRIKKAEDENKTLTASVNKYLLENAALKDELEKLRNNSGNDAKVKELEDKIKTLEDENKSLKENAPNEEAIRQKIEAEFEVKMYAQEQINANKDSIISILIPEITGKTKEEIDSAIASAKEKTKTIKKDLGLDVDDEGDDKSKGKKTPAPQKQKKAPAAAPAVDGDGEEFDAEYVRNLDPRSPEYAEFRKKMGLR